MAGQPGNVVLARRPDSGVTISLSFTPERRALVVSELERSGNLSAAADAAGVSRNSVIYQRAKDPEFDAACQEALDRATDRLERKVRARAENGTKRGVWYKGELVGHERETHDNLSMFMLKAHRPEVYRPDVAVQVGVGLSVEGVAKLTTQELEALVARAKSNNLEQLHEPHTLSQECVLSTDTTPSAAYGVVVHGSKGPKTPGPGGGGLDARTQRGPKQQHRRASPRRKQKRTQK